MVVTLLILSFFQHLQNCSLHFNNAPVQHAKVNRFQITIHHFIYIFVMCTPSIEYTMVFLDLDNTLIPTKMASIFQHYFNIDLFSSFPQTLLRRLQYSIIKAIEIIKLSLQKQNKNVIFSVVSNAKSIWLDVMLKYNPTGVSAIFPILSKD